jgi:dihydroorotate dehydrogenase
VYTAFGYDGPGCCRRIKDELVRELEREGTTWDEVVRNAVEKSSLRAEVSERNVEREDNSTAIGVKVLIKEAEELRDLLDRLDERWEKDRSPKGMGDVVEASGLLRPSS